MLQCQDDVDWAYVTKALTKNTANILEFVYCWISSSSKYVQKGTITSALILRPLAFTKLLDFIPIFFEKGFGIKEIDGHVRITLVKLAEVLAKNIDSIGKNDSPLNRAITAHHAGKKMINWANDQWKNRMPEFESSAKSAKWPELEIPKFGGRFSNFTAVSSLELLGKGGDGAVSMVSFLANIDVLIQLMQSSAFEQAGPTTPHNWVAPTQTLSTAVATISAAIVDRAGAQRAQLLLANKALNSRYFYSAVRMGLPSLLAAATKGGAKLASAKIDIKLDHMKAANYAANLTRLIAVSNLALLVSSTAEDVDAYDSGNRGLIYANINRMISYSMFAAGPILTMRSISSATIQSGYFALIGFALLLVAEGMKVKYSKSALENLLFRCFWGRSNKYSFWDFDSAGDFDISQRLNIAATEYRKKRFN